MSYQHSQCPHEIDYRNQIQLHTFFGVAALLPLMLFSFQAIMNALVEGLDSGFTESGQTLALTTPLLVMIGPLIALYITIFRFIRVSIARIALILLTCGVCYCTLFLSDKMFGYVPSLFLASFIPYFYVRWIGRSMLKKEKLLTQSQIGKLNSAE